MTLTFDLLTLKVMSESHVTWATSVPILVFLGLSVLELGPMYATDRQTDRRQTDVRKKHCLMPIRGGGITSAKLTKELGCVVLMIVLDINLRLQYAPRLSKWILKTS